MTTDLNKFVKPSLIGQQSYFMTLCRQKRFNLLQTLNGLTSRDRKLFSTMVMAMGLINEEWNKETLPVIQELLGGVASNKASEEDVVEDLVKIADGLIDTIYVCASFLNMFGFPGDEIWDIIQERNVAKAVTCGKCINGVLTGGDGETLGACQDCQGTGKIIVRRADGKILKPEGWYPPEPEIKALLLKKLKELRDAGATTDPSA